MARYPYNETICSIAADGTMKAISNVQVEVRKVSDNSLAQLWNSRTATGGGATVANPFITGATGAVSFYIAAGEYNITFTDQNAPARIATQTIGMDAVPGSQTFEVTGFAMGDLKISAQSADHGRWLKCNGRELSQAEVESALSLTAGDAAAFVTFMGTGATSKYGAAASSKVKVPDTRRKALVGTGTAADTTPAPMAGTTAKEFGNTAGAETHLLLADEGAIRTHTHSAGTYAAASHTHAQGTYAVASHTHDDGSLTVASHTHAFGTLAVSSHTHGAGTLAVAAHTHTAGTIAVSAHNHAVGTLAVNSHSHSAGSLWTGSTVDGYDNVDRNHDGVWWAAAYYIHAHSVVGNTGSSAPGINGATANATPTVSGSTGSTTPAVSTGATAAATPTMSGATAGGTADVTGATGAATPALTGASAATSPAVTGASGTQTTQAAGGYNATTAHNNMQPYVSIGYVFIRV